MNSDIASSYQQQSYINVKFKTVHKHNPNPFHIISHHLIIINYISLWRILNLQSYFSLTDVEW